MWAVDCVYVCCMSYVCLCLPLTKDLTLYVLSSIESITQGRYGILNTAVVLNMCITHYHQKTQISDGLRYSQS